MVNSPVGRMVTDVMDIDELRGLSRREVDRRLAEEGYNELPSSGRRPWHGIAIDVVREPMFVLLIACGILYLVIGDAEEALLLLSFVFVIIGITFLQERKTERALEALRDLSSPRALVIRDGVKTRIAGREVVRGDVLLLSEGDRVTADAVVISCTNLFVDESLLTGESAPVSKVPGAGDTDMRRPAGDGQPFVYSGTMVVKGQGIARVKRIGSATEMGAIGKALQALETEHTPLQRQTRGLVKVFAFIGLIVCALLVLTLGVSRGNWLNGLLAGLTLAMAMLPEEFPVVLTVFLALGAWRMSRNSVLTRRIPVVETLGAATVLCVDKTGTLTLNRMSVSEILVDEKIWELSAQGMRLPDEFHSIVEYSVLASPADPFDPMEQAVKELADRTLSGTEHIHTGWSLVKEYPLTERLLAMSRVWRSPDGGEMLIAAKGAPEAIADLCHLDPADATRMERKVDCLAQRGRRVLGVARARLTPEQLPSVQHDFDFEFLGLLGLEDPVRPEVPAAVRECYDAGVRVIMITGDYPATAQNVAGRIGLMNHGAVITGDDLDVMDDAELRQRIKIVNIFARTAPEQKLRIVDALKTNGEVVAMTGDGVNDAPALRSSHIGIAMGGRGTDVAREAAALVLLNDDFGSIVEAVHMGRRIYDNLKKALMFIVSVHIPIAGMSLLPVAFKWPLALFPAHIVFLQLIIDPACSLAFEAESAGPDIMRRRPRRLNEPLIGVQSLIPSLVQGAAVLAAVLGVYDWFLMVDGEAVARTAAFTTMVLCSLGLIVTNRSWPRPLSATLSMPNAPLWWVIGGAIALLALVLYVPFLNRLFRFSFAGVYELSMCAAAGLLSMAVAEVLKAKPIRRLFS